MEWFLPSHQNSETAENLHPQFCIKSILDVSSLYQNPWIMFGIKRALTASISMGIWLFSTYGYAEDRFTTEEFLQWEEVSRRSYIQTSMMMANMIANENDQKQSSCISDWYAEDRRGREQYIYNVMKKAAGYHPMGVIVAVLENKCGPFKYK